MTIFVITKNQSQERLILWPWIFNDLCSDLPSPDFPEPTHFNQFLHEDGTLKLIYLVISNMFQNLPLHLHSRDLLPLPTFRFGDYPLFIQQHISEALRLPFTSPNELIRLSQAPAPMGFALSVILAHYCVRNITKASYTTILTRVKWENKDLQFLRKANSPFTITKITLSVTIIDDIGIFLSSWYDHWVLV